ncbi:unnamed protein product, partial [Allacma fusca]
MNPEDPRYMYHRIPKDFKSVWTLLLWTAFEYYVYVGIVGLFYFIFFLLDFMWDVQRLLADIFLAINVHDFDNGPSIWYLWN